MTVCKRKGVIFSFTWKNFRRTAGVSQNAFLNGPTFKLKGSLQTSLPKQCWHWKPVTSAATKAAFVIRNITLLRFLQTSMSYTSCNYHVILWYRGKKTEYDYDSLAQQCKPWHFLSSAFPFLAWTLGSTFPNYHIFDWRSKKAGGLTPAAAVLWTLFTLTHPQLFLKMC